MCFIFHILQYSVYRDPQNLQTGPLTQGTADADGNFIT